MTMVNLVQGAQINWYIIPEVVLGVTPARLANAWDGSSLGKFYGGPADF